MKIRAGFDIAFDVAQPTPIVLMLSLHPSRAEDLLTDSQIQISPDVPLHNYHDMFGNICGRLTAPAGRIAFSSAFEVRDSGQPDEVWTRARRLPVEALPDDTLVYLMGSRYCDTQKLSDFAWRTFSSSANGWETVQAICDFVHDRIKFGYADARDDRTAFEGFNERVGVCRDFAHLAIALCRCVNIPARYCTGYLGDIGVPPDPAPMDFSAWFEAFVGDRWFTFDARHNQPRIGRILIARGRDAADVAISTSFGRCELVRFTVMAEEISTRRAVQPKGSLRAVA